MKTRSAKPRAADAEKAPLLTKAHSLRRGNQALAAPLIVPADVDEAVSRARASMREKSMTLKTLLRKSTRQTNLL